MKLASRLVQSLILIVCDPFLLASSLIGLTLIVTGQTIQSVRKIWR
jgi:hypothetical protein